MNHRLKRLPRLLKSGRNILHPAILLDERIEPELLSHPKPAELLQIGEIDIKGDVTLTKAHVDTLTFLASVVDIGAQRAARAALVKIGAKLAVVDGEHRAR